MALDEEKDLQHLEAILDALRESPTDQAVHRNSYELLEKSSHKSPSLLIQHHTIAREILRILMEGGVINPKDLAHAIIETIIQRYQIRPDTDITDYDKTWLALTQDALLLSILERSVNRHVAFEHFLIGLRRHILFSYQTRAPLLNTMNPLLAAMAQQCFNNEYIFYEDDDEKDAVDHLITSLKQTIGRNEISTIEIPLLIAGMYVPLYSLPFMQAVAEAPIAIFSEPVQKIVQRLILEPRKEQEISRSIASIGTITDTTSKAVQRQYEEHPYPRWLNLYGQVRSIESKLKNNNHDFAWPSAFYGIKQHILVPGCGTGQHPIRIADSNPQAHIWAVDLSKASLAYGIRKTQELQIHNITFFHGDLLDIPGLEQSFHHIDCVGVLHHMAHPEDGWRVLDKVLLPGGTMHIGVYSEVARMPIIFFRNEIQKQQILPTPESMKTFRHLLITQKKDDALSSSILSNDFFSLSTFRDLLFHVREHRYTLSEIQGIINDLDYQFLNCIMPTKKLKDTYLSMYPSDRNMNAFENWLQFERYYVGSGGMFDFYLQKKQVDEQDTGA